MRDFKILVIHKRTVYQELIESGSNCAAAMLLKQKDPIVEKMIVAHKNHIDSMEAVKKELENRKLDTTWRYDFSGLIPDNFDLVITIGGDGTVLHASHYINQTPILAINSSPLTSFGYFTAGGVDEFASLIDRVLKKKLNPLRLYRMEVSVNGEVVNSRVMNDVLFSNQCPASTTRYILYHGKSLENQSSSGLWIGTAAGSTAALKAAGGKTMKLSSARVQYLVREPCHGIGKKPLLIKGIVSEDELLALRSRSTSACLYIDGPHVVVPVEFGDMISIKGGSSPIFIYRDIYKK